MPKDTVIGPMSANDEGRTKPSTARVREMLGIYSRLDDRGREDLIAEYRTLTAVETAILHSDEGLAENLKRFRTDHKKAFRVPFGQYAPLLAVGLLGLLVCIYAVMFGS
jgi:hypothetical protein